MALLSSTKLKVGAKTVVKVYYKGQVVYTAPAA